jgi:tetratricopeptide (TPR) repeat protein
MKQEPRAIAAVLLLATTSCALLFGERGGADAGAEAAAAEYAQAFSRIPAWVRPSPRDFGRSEELRGAVALLERREPVSAAIRLQSLRARERWGPEVTALHAWALVESGSAADARRVALDGLAEHGAGAVALHYALAVAAEVSAQPAEALAAYRRVLAQAPGDAVMLRACARTALASGDAVAALEHLAGLPDAVTGADGLELARLRAAALSGAGRHAEALAVHERVAAANAEDFSLRASAAAGAFAAAEAAGEQDLRARARALVEAVTAADPQHAEAHWMLGRLAAGLGDVDAAEAALRRTLELDPARVDAGILLAQLLDETLRKDDARAVLFELLRQPLSAAQVEAVQRRLLELEQA